MVQTNVSKIDASLALSIANWLRKHGKVVHPPLSSASKRQLKECFELMDADGSGAIDAEELHAAFKLLGLSMTRAEVITLIEEVDKDGSGEVDYCEFLQIMTTTLSKTAEDSDGSNSGGTPKEAFIPFSLMATAYRRKRMIEGLILRDKGVQEQVARMAEELEASKSTDSSQDALVRPSSYSVGSRKILESSGIANKDEERLADSLVPRRIKEQEQSRTLYNNANELEAKREKLSSNMLANRCAVQGFRIGVPCTDNGENLLINDQKRSSVRDKVWWSRLVSKGAENVKESGPLGLPIVSTKLSLLQSAYSRKFPKRSSIVGYEKSCSFLPPISAQCTSSGNKNSTLSFHTNANFWEMSTESNLEGSSGGLNQFPSEFDFPDIQQNGLRRKTLLLDTKILAQI